MIDVISHKSHTMHSPVVGWAAVNFNFGEGIAEHSTSSIVVSGGVPRLIK